MTLLIFISFSSHITLIVCEWYFMICNSMWAAWGSKQTGFQFIILFPQQPLVASTPQGHISKGINFDSYQFIWTESHHHLSSTIHINYFIRFRKKVFSWIRIVIFMLHYSSLNSRAMPAECIEWFIIQTTNKTIDWRKKVKNPRKKDEEKKMLFNFWQMYVAIAELIVLAIIDLVSQIIKRRIQWDNSF